MLFTKDTPRFYLELEAHLWDAIAESSIRPEISYDRPASSLSILFLCHE